MQKPAVVMMELPYDRVQFGMDIEPSSVEAPLLKAIEELTSRLRKGDTWASEDAVSRILTSAVLLKAVSDYTMGECLDTAMVWEFG